MPRKIVKLVEITAKGPAAQKDEAAAFFIAAGSPGVVELNTGLPDDLLLSYTSIETPPPEADSAQEAASLKAYLKAGAPLRSLRKAMKSMGWSFTACAYKDRDWVKNARARTRPVRISPSKKKGDKRSILVRPSWSKVKKRPGDIVIVLDPGMAFGTGSHFTTKTCLRALLDVMGKGGGLADDISFLDVGTGTGILAIAAKKLGARKAVGVDIDATAVRTAKFNAKRNRVKISISAAPVEDVLGAFNVVAANILAGDLKRLAPVIAAKTAKAGFLILSGILVGEAHEVSAVYERFGFKPFFSFPSSAWERENNEWTTLLMRKASPFSEGGLGGLCR
ncbi:MAG: 50S ribosomal protein L11 methyltransferase [Deltaproteobacteria bacterium]|nr:50S ribosomal protein L11 methyltransferase [Deltaproteobacteria bacterium]